MLDEAFGGKAMERLAHRDHADTDFGRARAIDKPVARRELPAGQLDSNVVVRLFRERPLHNFLSSRLSVLRSMIML